MKKDNTLLRLPSFETHNLKEKIAKREAKIGIVGLGYVGLPLAMEFIRAGFEVHGVDVNAGKVEGLNAGRSHVLDVPDSAVAGGVATGKFKAYTAYDIMSSVDCVSICVPTPLKKTRDPDISYVTQAVQGVLPHLHKDMLVVLESTTYPGTTDEIVRSEIHSAFGSMPS